jgi:hypothetical protein
MIHVQRQNVKHLLKHFAEAFLHHGDRSDFRSEAFSEHIDELQEPTYLILVCVRSHGQSSNEAVHDLNSHLPSIVVVEALVGHEDAYDVVEE